VQPHSALLASTHRLLPSSTPHAQHVSLQLHTSAVNATLLAFAAERRPAAPLLPAPGAAAVDRYLPPARRSAANPLHAVAAIE